MLRDRIRFLQGEQTRAEGALERALSQPARATDIDGDEIERFAQLLSAKLDDGAVNARRGTIAAIVSRIEDERV